MTVTVSSPDTVSTLEDLETRLRWLAAWTIHNANHIRENVDGIKVGGHQASCASMSAIMRPVSASAISPCATI